MYGIRMHLDLGKWICERTGQPTPFSAAASVYKKHHCMRDSDIFLLGTLGPGDMQEALSCACVIHTNLQLHVHCDRPFSESLRDSAHVPTNADNLTIIMCRLMWMTQAHKLHTLRPHEVSCPLVLRYPERIIMSGWRLWLCLQSR